MGASPQHGARLSDPATTELHVPAVLGSLTAIAHFVRAVAVAAGLDRGPPTGSGSRWTNWRRTS